MMKKVTMGGGAERARGGGGAAGGGRARTRRGRGRGGEGARGEHGAGAGRGCARGAARGVGSVGGPTRRPSGALSTTTDVDPARTTSGARQLPRERKAAPCKKYRLLYDSNLGRRFGAPARLAERFSTVDSGCVARGDSPIARRGPTASSLVVRTK